MEFFDEVVNKAKEAFDVASKKTNEVVSVQKLKFEAASMESKLSKDFETLGRLVFDGQQNHVDHGDSIAALIEEIRVKQEKLASLKDQILKMKGKTLCAHCGAALQTGAMYCSFCGASVQAGAAEASEQAAE